MTIILCFGVGGVALARSLEIKGEALSPDVKTYLDKTVGLTLSNNPETSLFVVRQMVFDALYAQGYYDAEARFSAEKDKITADITPNKLYRLADIKFTGYDVKADQVNLKEGDPLDAQKILTELEKLRVLLDKESCLYDLKIDHQIRLMPDTHTGHLRIIIAHQGKATFGATEFSGAPDINEPYLQRLLAYKEGECWSREAVNETHTALFQSGLISTVTLNAPKTKPQDGDIPMSFNLVQTDARRIRVGASYFTESGPGLSAEWSHKNFMGSAEILKTYFDVNFLDQTIGADLTLPTFLRLDQSLSMNAELTREESDAFLETSLTTGATLKRKLNKRLAAFLGIEFELTSIDDENTDDEEFFALMSFPAGVSQDTRDNVLNPKKGYLLSGSLTPTFDVLGEADPFFKGEMRGQTYFNFDKYGVLALRGYLGSLQGAETDNIPATKRFYAGGGGSVRGFGYQEIGPQENGDPAGGRSVAEASVEYRFPITKNIGGAAFMDAGIVSETTYPDFGYDDIFVGAGLGARYYTDFGPIRFDVALPVTQKEAAADRFQIYISIGQAF